MKYFALVLLVTAAHAAPGIGSSEPWPDVDDACYQMDKTCEIRKRTADILDPFKLTPRLMLDGLYI